MARRKFAREFKVSTVKLVNEQGYSIANAAKSLGIEPGTVRYWVEKFSGEGGGSERRRSPQGGVAAAAEGERAVC